MQCEYLRIIQDLFYIIKNRYKKIFLLFIIGFSIPQIPLASTPILNTPMCKYKLIAYKPTANVNNKTEHGFLVSDVEKNNNLLALPIENHLPKNFYSEKTRDELCILWNKYLDNPSAHKNKIILVARSNILPPIPQSKNIIAVGLNYPQHNQEVGIKNMVLFSKNIPFSSAYAPLERPNGTLLDWEIELGIILRKPIHNAEEIKNIPPQEYIAGFVMVNDITDRIPIIWDPKRGFSEGKTLPGFLPIGPYYVPIENFSDENKKNPNLQMQLKINSELKQNANTKDMIYTIDVIIEKILKNHAQLWKLANGKTISLLENNYLEAGDLIITGTPGGTALQAPSFLEKIKLAFRSIMNFEHPKKIFIRKEYCSGKYLRANDHIYAEISDLGKQDIPIIENFSKEMPISCE